jgi:hypothetical protein
MQQTGFDPETGERVGNKNQGAKPSQDVADYASKHGISVSAAQAIKDSRMGK